MGGETRGIISPRAQVSATGHERNIFQPASLILEFHKAVFNFVQRVNIERRYSFFLKISLSLSLFFFFRPPSSNEQCQTKKQKTKKIKNQKKKENSLVAAFFHHFSLRPKILFFRSLS